MADTGTPRVEATDALPGYEPTHGRWAMPFQTTTDDGKRMWTVALRRANPLTTRERLAGCAAQVWADSLEALQPLTDAQDELVSVVKSLPPAWTERASGPPASPEVPRPGCRDLAPPTVRDHHSGPGGKAEPPGLSTSPGPGGSVRYSGGEAPAGVRW